MTTLKKYLPAFAGLFALIWFLVRVIPKPSRAAYLFLYGAPQLGYLYTARNYAGWTWCFGKGCWMLYVSGSGGWFYDASIGEYFKVG